MGFSLEKLVVGKTSSSTDLYNEGYIDPAILGGITERAFNELSWYAGVSFWQYSEDPEAVKCKLAAQKLKDSYEA